MIDRIEYANNLKAMRSSPGWQAFEKDCLASMQSEGWRKFIKLPVEQKTSKRAYKHQADYEAIEKLFDWLDERIKEGEQDEKRKK